ncbi:hypothetical protein LINGRAPRIM_LOCUS2593 [Linum grandiflorum]
MKQNGFLSSRPPHGGVPVPKQRGRKPKNDTLKRRMELAKKEQVDRFTKIAAPSGLLNDLNPGIINHVRNSRQVRSIIEALVKSEKLDNITREESHLRAGSKEPVCLSVLLAASVASQWLELLQQDIKGRLTALRRSKKRVRDVITTELPLLVTKEFGSNQDDATAAMHQARWNQLFDQMDRALSEEQRQLVSCVYVVSLYVPDSCLSALCRIPKGDSSEKELAVRAAAASIYSTCNFLMSKENVSCF